jgi:signal peptidase I
MSRADERNETAAGDRPHTDSGDRSPTDAEGDSQGRTETLVDRLRLPGRERPRPPEPKAPEPRKARKKKKGRSLASRLAEIPVLIVFAFVIAVLIKTFLVQAFYIPSGSMLPTLHVGDRILIEKLSYRFGDPNRGDVVVFAKSVFGPEPPDLPWYEDARNFGRELLGLPTTNSEEDYIKRVVAVGGDTLSYSGTPRELVVNGEPVPEPYIRGNRDRSSGQVTPQNCRQLDMKIKDDGCLVPAGTVFVMGDNRMNSSDSRSSGPVDEDKILGRAFVIIWPPSDFGGL